MAQGKTLFVASFDVDGSQDAEFERWYAGTHVPDALGIPGYESVRRYRNAGPFENADTGARYLNIYELESVDAFAAGWATDKRKACSADFNRWIPALSNANVGVYVEREPGA